jgi:hypothetical protein
MKAEMPTLARSVLLMMRRVVVGRANDVDLRNHEQGD